MAAATPSPGTFQFPPAAPVQMSHRVWVSPGQRVGVEGLGLIAGVSTQPFPNRAPLRAAGEEEEDSEEQHATKERERNKGYRAQLQSVYHTRMLLVWGSLMQTQLNNSLARESPCTRRGTQSLSDGFKLFLWISLNPAQNKSRRQICKGSTTSVLTPQCSLCTGKTKTKPSTNSDGYTSKQSK